MDEKTDNNPLGSGLPDYLPGWLEFTLSRASLRAKEIFEEALEPLNIRSKHYAVMALLRENGAMGQQVAGDRLGIDRTTMVSLIDDLEKLRLAERRLNTGDRRSYLIRLTSKGEVSLLRADAAVSSAENRLLAQLSTVERQQLHSLLDRISIGTGKRK